MGTYRDLMDSEPSMPERLEQGSLLTPGILGGSTFLNRLPHRVRSRFQPSDAHLPLEIIVHHVAKLCRLRVDEILSTCRGHTLVLARALIAWYATEHQATTLREVSRFLRRDMSSVSRAVSRHRHNHPTLFSLKTFATLRARVEPARTSQRFSPLRGTASFLKDPRIDSRDCPAMHSGELTPQRNQSSRRQLE
jgi:hypothetical protein